jgi:alpha-L-fucosidase
MLAQRSISALCLLAATALSPFCALAQSSTAPTASETAESLADVWQKAVAKYDGPRTSILAGVDRGIHEGPFRADWNSLSRYKVPDWYRDAKFGIFIHWGV